MSSYYLCAAGVTLRNQINRKWPRRDKASDGWIGDASHQADPTSNHNPDWTSTPPGVVRAIDVDSDLNVRTGNHALATQLAEELRELAKSREHTRISYIIWQRRICSDRDNWAWRPYTGQDPHTNHIHISFKPNGDKNGAKFNLPCLKTVLSR